MDEMVEQVAKAIWYSDPEQDEDWDTIPPHWKDEFYPKARAAIAVMREPTDRMKLAGARSIGRSMREANYLVRSLKCWQVMTTIALDDEQSLPPLPENKG